MKITVRITGILEAELELPEPQSVNSMSSCAQWLGWHADQHTAAKSFVRCCAEEVTKITTAARASAD